MTPILGHGGAKLLRLGPELPLATWTHYSTARGWETWTEERLYVQSAPESGLHREEEKARDCRGSFDLFTHLIMK